MIKYNYTFDVDELEDQVDKTEGIEDIKPPLNKLQPQGTPNGNASED